LFGHYVIIVVGWCVVVGCVFVVVFVVVGVCVVGCVLLGVSIFHFVKLILSYYKMIRDAYSVRLSLLLNMFMKSK